MHRSFNPHLKLGRAFGLSSRASVQSKKSFLHRLVKQPGPINAAYNSGNGRYETPFEGAAQRKPLSRKELSDRNRKLNELLTEIGRIAIATGPKGAIRAMQAANALFVVGQEYLIKFQAGVQDPPQVVLRKLFEKLGATYIKLGQFIASSPTLFPEEYVLEFQKCLDKTEPVPWEVIRGIIQAELKTPVEDIFASVDPVPLACASVAQVHSAVLRNSNKQVVIKVLKPGVEDILQTDLSFLYVAARVLEFLNPQIGRTSLAGIVGDVRLSMLEEVDFVKEAAHVLEFSNYLDRTGMRRVATCPYVYKQFSSTRVLTMERLTGVPMTDLAAIRSITTADPEATLISALNTWFGSVIGCDTFHADVHAGNLLVLADGRVGFIDFGIVGRISPVTWTAVQTLLIATTQSNYDLMARALVTLGVTDSDVDIPAFARDLQKLFVEIEQMDMDVVIGGGLNGSPLSASVAVDDTNVNRILLQIIRVGETHGIRFPREFGLLLKQLLYFDRYTRILAPQLSVLSDQRIQMGAMQARMESVLRS